MAGTKSSRKWTFQCLMVFLSWRIAACGSAPSHPTSNISATVACSLNGDVMIARMSFIFEGLETGIKAVFAYQTDRETIITSTEMCDLSNFTSGDTATVVASSVNTSDYSAVSNGCGHACADGMCNWLIGVRVISAAITTMHDRNFVVNCNVSNADSGLVVTGSVQVNDDSIRETVSPENITVRMNVLDSSGSTVTTAEIGSMLSLQVLMQGGTSVKCVALYDCYAASSMELVFSGTVDDANRLQFIGDNGCEIVNFMKLTDSFVRQSNTFSAGTGYVCDQRTGNFILFSFLTNPDALYFGCRYRLCLEDDDELCADLCAFPELRRKKRQARDDGEEYQFTVKLDITGNNSKATESTAATTALKKTSVLTDTLLIALCLGLISLMLVIIAILVFIVMRNRRRRKEKEAEIKS